MTDSVSSVPMQDKPIEVLSWSPYAVWKFKATYEDCPICKAHLEEPCLQCLESTNKTSMSSIICDASRGKCGHCFHKHCIDKWTDKTQICPVCTTPYATDIKNMNNNTDWIKLMNKK